MEETKIENCEKKIAHLSMIQGVITRMSGNLFFLKGWAVALIAGLFTATISFDKNLYFQLLLVLVLCFFWGFDAYFLSLERCYRDLYDEVRIKKESEVDFSMDFLKFKKYYKNSWFSSFFSLTLTCFYLILGVAMFVIIKFF